MIFVKLFETKDVYRVKLILTLYMVLNEHHIVQSFLKLEGIFLFGCNVAQRFV